MNFLVGLPYHTLVGEARKGRADVFARVVREVEDMGFWGLMIPHHISDPGGHSQAYTAAEVATWRYTDPMAMLGFLASVSRTAKLVTWVIVLPYRQPVELAHGLATVDSLSGGRLVFGAGVGVRESEFQLVGVPLKERGKIADEWLDIIIELWTKPNASYSGRCHSFKDATLTIRPVQQPRPPIWIGGGSRAAVRRAIRVGDVWSPPAYGGFAQMDGRRSAVSAQELKADLAWANDQRKPLGKPPLGAAVSTGTAIKLLPKGMASGSRSRAGPTYFTARGTLEEMTEEFQAYNQAGADSVIVHFDGAPEQFLKDATEFATRVIPALK